ncbi:MmgE/PrpD family protein [Salinibacterium sp. dk2585]|uniref:MmgE/PrpD family protein n=1 Tax=unclassified Salinibacterium TaxID=2632331 RepID=UPI0011C24BFA|nr:MULTISPECIES: MmgE/PrpD family protein [unclassified Salinibacterium]QEE60396.1 MmgE/PrpD family protein [Salinibacterium sp. dk2585]TXK55469.1 MmgE/PrpD family protein [Salinibacterium sp. dk5596]
MTDVTTLSARLAEFAVATAAELPQRIADDSRDRIIDTIGISIAARDTEPVQAAVALAREWGGNPQATLLGFADRVPAPTAALVNGTAAHALDFDDTHLPSILHPSASAVPAALAAAEVADVDGRTLLAAVAAGNEIAIRLGNAADDPELGNNVFFERGIHATSLCGAIGSAAAAAVALGLDAATTRHALGIAASMGSGILEANRNGGSVKRVHCGWAAHAGVTAAQFARQGITAPDTVLEGRFGFFQAFTGLHPIDEGFMAGLGEEWELDKCFIKPYPTNVFTHTGIDAAMLLSKRGIDIDSIERIDLSVPMSVTRTIAEPREAKLRPQSPYHAQFSGPLTFAMAWRGGSGLGLYLDDFMQEALDDPFVRTLSEKVHYVRDEEVESLYPERLPTIARVHMADGSVIEERVMANLGTVLRPIQPEQVQLKFDLNVRALGEQRAGALRGAITSLDGAASVRSVFSGLDFAESNSAA